MGKEDFPLPSLAPHLKLSHAPDDKGEPAYTIHNPIANSYFKIDWMTFECLSRMPFYKTFAELKEGVEHETTLKINADDIKSIINFLDKSGLLSLRDQKITQREPDAQLWKKIFHRYLFFSLPLFRPQNFLERTYDKIRWIYHPLFLRGMVGFLILMIILTLPRMDEFFHTFSSLFSAQGVVAVLIVFAFVKVIHEFAHAYTAIRHGVKVPHMGIAFMVLYPVLYTETTGSWALQSRRARFQIGMAGIAAELCLAAIFLLLWHLLPAGSMGHSLSFLVVCVSLVGSLLINLNPLMRFDGYYMLADATGFDNLQGRSCAFARHRLRKFLFGWNDAPPEDLSAQDQNFLIGFGFSLLIYRFFLFLGIAGFIYHIFFQPLGLIMMLAELSWFIFLPILSELKIWWKGRQRIVSSRRSLLPAGAIITALLFVTIPWRTSLFLPAMIHAGLHETIYPPSPAHLVHLHIEDGMAVERGQILAELASPKLEFDVRVARQELESLETLRRRGHNMIQALQSNKLSDVAIEKARLKVTALEEQKARLVITAPFDGVVRDLKAGKLEGRYLSEADALLTLVNLKTTAISAYATEEEREKIDADSAAIFFSESRTKKLGGFSISAIGDTGSAALQWEELASVYGGPIAADRDKDGIITGRRSLYEITAKNNQPAPPFAERGYLLVSRQASSLLSSWINALISIIRSETVTG